MVADVIPRIFGVNQCWRAPEFGNGDENGNG
jgi:hypothetical protein